MNLLSEAISLHQRGNLAGAAQLYRQVLQTAPRESNALKFLGIIELQSGNLAKAEGLFAASIASNPSSPDCHYYLGRLCLQKQESDRARHHFESVVRLEPGHVDALTCLGILSRDRHDLPQALDYFQRAVLANPRAVEALLGKGHCLIALGRPGDAIAVFDGALSINPRVAEAWHGRGSALHALKRHEEAIAAYDQAVAVDANLVQAWFGRGNALRDQRRYEGALAAYDQALAIKRDFADAWSARGDVFFLLKQHHEADAEYQKALSIRVDLPQAWVGRGNVLAALNRHDEALAAYDKALAISADCVEAWVGRGSTCRMCRQYDHALDAYQKALAIKPDLAEAWLGCGNLFARFGRYDDAVKSFGNAIGADPDAKFVLGHLVHSRLQTCNWQDLSDSQIDLVCRVRAGKCVAEPFTLLATAATAADQLRCAQVYVSNQAPAPKYFRWQGGTYRHDRKRIAYVSADFREHAVAFLMADLFERHDRSRFETFAISLSPDEPSAMRERLKGAFDRFVDVSRRSDQDVADLMREMEIDIAVDLMGYTGDARPNIFAFRAAPIQAMYLGYPGTLGAEFMDYIIADKTVLPFDQQPFYAEKIVHLPDCFMVADSKRAAVRGDATRSGEGLPERAFVFCCFNEAYKINPPIFDVWMRVLRAVEGSVLWLLRSNDFVMANLRREAEARGVDAARLIFAPRRRFEDHLARISLADLFLNTHPVNAGASAVDALSVGLPVLACTGDTMVSRVTASLLHAAGLPELVTEGLQDYEALARKLAAEPSLLQSLRRRLELDRDKCRLFDIDRFRRHLEAAYLEMWEIWQRGGPAQSFSVAPLS